MVRARKILFLFNAEAIRLRYKLIQKFHQEGWAAKVALPADKIEEWREKLPGINLIPFEAFSGTSIGIISNLKTLNKFRFLLKENRDHVLFLGNIKPIIYGGILARFMDIKNVYGLISGLGYAFIDEAGVKRSLIRWFCLKLYRFSFVEFSKVFFQNSDDRNLFVTKQVVALEKTQVVNGTGVDLQEFTPEPFPQNLTFFMAARLIREKGVFEYVEAAKVLKQKHKNVRFILAGSIDTNPSAITKEQLKSCEQVVEYVGFCKNMQEALKECSVFVYPSYYREGVPRALLEALACGRPVITTDSVGCKEAVLDQENGFKIEPRNVNALIEAMKNVIQSPYLLKNMGEKSRILAEKRFDIHIINTEMYQTVQESII